MPEPPPEPDLRITAESMGIPDVETSEAALVAIAQDAVVILRRELAFKALLSIENPGTVALGDCIALLRLATELGAAARRGSEEVGQRANYDRLSPQQRVQLASLLLLVDYTDAP
jgi:hypothetical protein